MITVIWIEVQFIVIYYLLEKKREINGAPYKDFTRALEHLILVHAVHDLAKKGEDLRESQRSFVTIDQLTKALEPISKALNELIKVRGDDQDCPLVNVARKIFRMMMTTKLRFLNSTGN